MAEVRVKTSGQTLDGTIIENISTEETLAAVLEQLKILNKVQNDFSKLTKDTDKKNDKKADDRFDKHFGKTLLGKLHSTVGQHVDSKIKEIPVISSILGSIGEIPVFGEALAALLPELGVAVLVFEVFTGALRIAKDILIGLAHAAGTLASAYFDGKTELSTYTGVIATLLDKIPIIGTFAEIIQDGIKLIESWNNKLYELSLYGATFNGSLEVMRSAAAHTGLSLEEFAKIITGNADKLSIFGSVMDGVNRFTNISQISLNRFRSGLNAAGISMAQYNDELPVLLDLLGTSSTARHESDAALAQSAYDLTKEFNAMSQLTGKTRKEQADALLQQNSDTAFQLKLSEMTADQRKNEETILARLNATLGPTAADLYKLRVLGFQPTTQQLILMSKIIPVDQLDKLRDSVAQGTYNQNELNSSTLNMVASAVHNAKTYENLLRAGSAHLGGVPEALQGVVNELLANKHGLILNGELDRQEYLRRIQDAETAATQQDAYKHAFDTFTGYIMEGQAALYDNLIIPLMKAAEPYIQQFTRWFTANPFPVAKIQSIVKWFADELLKLYGWLSGLNWKEVGSNFTEFIKQLPMLVTDLGTLVGVIHGFAQGISAIKTDVTVTGPTALQVAKSFLGFSGGTVSSGAVIQNFGSGKPAMLHGHEAVLTEKQLANLVNNSSQTYDNSPIVQKLEELNDIVDNLLKSSREIARAVK